MKFKSPSLLRTYSLFLIIIGGIGLVDGLLLSSQQGQIDIPIITYALIIGIGLFYHFRQAWTAALISSIIIFAFDVLAFFSVLASGNYFTETIVFFTKRFGEIEVSNTIFFPISLILFGGQIWFLFSRPIQEIFSRKRIEKA